MTALKTPLKIILANPDANLNGAILRLLHSETDIQLVARCENLDGLYQAIAAFPGSVAVFPSSLRPDMDRLRILLETTASKAIVILNHNEPADMYLQHGLSGALCRNFTVQTLTACIHQVAAGELWLPYPLLNPASSTLDTVNLRFFHRLTSEERRSLSNIGHAFRTRMKAALPQRNCLPYHSLQIPA